MTKYEDQPCERCGSKKIVSKTWKEMTEVFGNMVEVECSQIICSSEECQKKFDNNFKKESKKRALLAKMKEERDLLRKETLRTKAEKRKSELN